MQSIANSQVSVLDCMMLLAGARSMVGALFIDCRISAMRKSCTRSSFRSPWLPRRTSLDTKDGTDFIPSLLTNYNLVRSRSAYVKAISEKLSD